MSNTPREFPIGKPIKLAGLAILKRKGTRAATALTEYYIEYLCCGTKTWLLHTQISRRIQGRQVRCRQCGVDSRKREPRKSAAYYEDRNSRDFKPIQIPMPIWNLPSRSWELKELHDTAVAVRRPYV